MIYGGMDLSTRGIVANKPMSKDIKMEAVSFQRHEPGPKDVVIEVVFCGVCHSDLHHVEGSMGESALPCVPGHEIAGYAKWVGAEVSKVKVGDPVGVGCMVDSCMSCEFCKMDDEQYCEGGSTMTYGGEPKHGHAGTEKTRGGYSDKMVVHEAFVIRLPDDMPLEVAGPVMCAGITVFDPLVHWKAGSEHVKRIGIIGGGGLGHMGIKLAKSLGCDVTAISTSPSKADHLKSIGASRVVISTDESAMSDAAKSLDLILNTISAPHDIMQYQALLRPNGVLVQLGLVQKPHELVQVPLLMARSTIAGSLIGGIKRTQELVDLCARDKIYPDVKVVSCDKIDSVLDELTQKSSTVQRYVLDIKNTMDEFFQGRSEQKFGEGKLAES